MKHTLLTVIIIGLGFISCAQSAADNTMAQSNPSVLFLNPRQVNASDCVGEWVFNGYHLLLLANNKAVWKDNGHIYYMTWTSEYAQNGDIKISLNGNKYCKYQSFYLNQTGTGMELVEAPTNAQMHFSKEDVASIE